jgi:hypothetical protein
MPGYLLSVSVNLSILAGFVDSAALYFRDTISRIAPNVATTVLHNAMISHDVIGKMINSQSKPKMILPLTLPQIGIQPPANARQVNTSGRTKDKMAPIHAKAIKITIIAFIQLGVFFMSYPFLLLGKL